MHGVRVIDGKKYRIFIGGTKKVVREMGGVRAIRVREIEIRLYFISMTLNLIVKISLVEGNILVRSETFLPGLMIFSL